MKEFFMWVTVMTWHLSRIMVGMPGFRYLSDTKGMVCSFFVVYMASELVRFGILYPEFQNAESVMAAAGVLLKATGSALISVVLTWLLLERKDRNSSLGSAALGVFTVFNLVSMLLFAVGVRGIQPTLVEGTMTVMYLFITYASFLQAPKEAQAAGYRYRDHKAANDPQTVTPKA